MHVHDSNFLQSGGYGNIDSRIRYSQVSARNLTLRITSRWWNDEEKMSSSGRIFYHHKPIKLPDDLRTGKEGPRRGKSKGGEITNNANGHHRIPHNFYGGISADEADTRL